MSINLSKLYETEAMLVGHIYETVYLLDKVSGQTIWTGYFYGNPTCGLISEKEDWCLVGGEKLLLWTKKEVIEFKDVGLRWIYGFKQIDSNKVEILIDPWAENSSIWELDIDTKFPTKMRDFDDYKGKEYTENVKW